MPGIDLRESFNNILHGIKNGEFKNEYEFQVKLFSTFNLAHDGHFRFAPDLMSRIQFRRRVQLVSVSRDGIEIPKIYVRGMFKPVFHLWPKLLFTDIVGAVVKFQVVQFSYLLFLKAS